VPWEAACLARARKRPARNRLGALRHGPQLTPPRLKLVADLALGGRFRIVAIVGAQMPEADRESLRRRLNGAEVVSLGWLKPRDVREFLRRASEAHGFAWSEEDIEVRVQGAGGYPMGMAAAVGNERRRRGRRSACRVVMVD
jgi:hypothetical protein